MSASQVTSILVVCWLLVTAVSAVLLVSLRNASARLLLWSTLFLRPGGLLNLLAGILLLWVVLFVLVLKTLRLGSLLTLGLFSSVCSCLFL